MGIRLDIKARQGHRYDFDELHVMCVTLDDPDCVDVLPPKLPPESSCLGLVMMRRQEMAYRSVMTSVLWPISSRIVSWSTPITAH